MREVFFLQTKPQVKIMIKNRFDLYYTFNKNRVIYDKFNDYMSMLY